MSQRESGHSTGYFNLTGKFAMFVPQHNETLRTVLWGLGAIGTEDEQRTVDAVYRALEPFNFSKGFRENISKVYPETISDLPAPQVVWWDWSSPQRLLDCQQLLGLRPTRSDADQSPRARDERAAKRLSGRALAW